MAIQYSNGLYSVVDTVVYMIVCMFIDVLVCMNMYKCICNGVHECVCVQVRAVALYNPVVVSVTVLHYVCSKVIWSGQLIVSPSIVSTCCVNVS